MVCPDFWFEGKNPCTGFYAATLLRDFSDFIRKSQNSIPVATGFTVKITAPDYSGTYFKLN
jgi:hypothetical protein